MALSLPSVWLRSGSLRLLVELRGGRCGLYYDELESINYSRTSACTLSLAQISRHPRCYLLPRVRFAHLKLRLPLRRRRLLVHGWSSGRSGPSAAVQVHPSHLAGKATGARGRRRRLLHRMKRRSISSRRRHHLRWGGGVALPWRRRRVSALLGQLLGGL